MLNDTISSDLVPQEEYSYKKEVFYLFSTDFMSKINI